MEGGEEGGEVQGQGKRGRGRELPFNPDMIRFVSKLNPAPGGAEVGLCQLVAVAEGREGWIGVGV